LGNDFWTHTENVLDYRKKLETNIKQLLLVIQRTQHTFRYDYKELMRNNKSKDSKGSSKIYHP